MARDPLPSSVNKVVFGTDVVFDVTDLTVEESDVLNNKTFVDKTGQHLVGTCSYDADTSDANAKASEILSSKTAYVAGAKVTGTMPNRGKQQSTISEKAQTITIQNGYHDGSGTVSISSTEQAKIIPENIAEGTTILGVVGSHSSAAPVKVEASKTIAPNANGQTVLPSSGYDALGQVIVEAIPITIVLNAQGGYTVTIL